MYKICWTQPKTGTVDGNRTRRDLIDSQVSPPGGLYGINWWSVIESNYLATTLLNKAYRVTAGNREHTPLIGAG